jgi:7,8-dihydropterin-6-yl-methyl-4-(beta-D-ribofuranosyl)aminobenzene 5'-phosphate synthase
MKNLLFITTIAVLVLFGAEKCYCATETHNLANEASTVKIEIIFDNYTQDGAGIPGYWGFACVIKGLEKTVLFDTGSATPSVLLENIRKAVIDPLEIEIVVLSHEHGDHVGGLEAFLAVNHNVTVYMPPSFSAEIKNKVSSHGARLIEVTAGQELCSGLFTTGEMGTQIAEQSVYFEGKDGLVVITGCAHPGIVNIVRKAKELSGKTPFMALGGFHLMQHSEEAVRQIISDLKGLGIQRVFPTHCTGDRAREIFREEFGKGYINGGLGSEITVNLP